MHPCQTLQAAYSSSTLCGRACGGCFPHIPAGTLDPCALLRQLGLVVDGEPRRYPGADDPLPLSLPLRPCLIRTFPPDLPAKNRSRISDVGRVNTPLLGAHYHDCQR
jgi:hypothetical protein